MPFGHSRLAEPFSALKATASTSYPIDPSPSTKSATQKTPQKTPLHATHDFLSRDVLTFSCYAPPSTDLLIAGDRFPPLNITIDRHTSSPPPFPTIQHPRSPSTENANTRETDHLKLLDTLFLVIYSHF